MKSFIRWFFYLFAIFGYSRGLVKPGSSLVCVEFCKLLNSCADLYTPFFYLHVESASCYLPMFVFWLFEGSINRSSVSRSGPLWPLQECWSCWLFRLWLHRADRTLSTILHPSLQLLGQAETLKASCWDSADRCLLWGADIIRVESSSLLLSRFSEGKTEMKKERRIEGGRGEGKV